jgi:hypothetical protein
MEASLGNIAALKELDDTARRLYSGDAGLREAQRVLAERRKLRFTRGWAASDGDDVDTARDARSARDDEEADGLNDGGVGSSGARSRGRGEEDSGLSALFGQGLGPGSEVGRSLGAGSTRNQAPVVGGRGGGRIDALGEELLRLAKGGGADAEDL